MIMELWPFILVAAVIIGLIVWFASFINERFFADRQIVKRVIKKKVKTL